MTATVTHDVNCRRGGPHSDAAKRVSDEYNLHRIGSGGLAVGKWFAVALHDGASDHVLYDSKRDAIRHQKHNEQFYAYVRIVPASMSPCEAESFLATHRALYDRGLRMPDPDDVDGGREVIPRLTVEDQRASIRSIVCGTPPRNLIWPKEQA